MIQDINIDVTDWTMFNWFELGVEPPCVACVYFLFFDDELVYIGNTKNLRQRIMYHDAFLNPNIYVGGKKISQDVFNKIFYRVEKDKDMRKRLEKKYYNAFEPKINFNGIFSPYHYNTRAKMMQYRLAMGLEKRYEV